MSDMNCVNCGAIVNPGDSVCMNCGAPVGGNGGMPMNNGGMMPQNNMPPQMDPNMNNGMMNNNMGLPTGPDDSVSNSGKSYSTIGVFTDSKLTNLFSIGLYYIIIVII